MLNKNVVKCLLRLQVPGLYIDYLSSITEQLKPDIIIHKGTQSALNLQWAERFCAKRLHWPTENDYFDIQESQQETVYILILIYYSFYMPQGSKNIPFRPIQIHLYSTRGVVNAMLFGLFRLFEAIVKFY